MYTMIHYTKYQTVQATGKMLILKAKKKKKKCGSGWHPIPFSP